VERGLHVVLLAAAQPAHAVEPVGVVRARHAGEHEGEAAVGAALGSGEGLVQHAHLPVDLRVREAPDPPVGDHVEVDRHGGAEVRLSLSLRRLRHVGVDLTEIGLADGSAAARGHGVRARE
jgi:hypothetical protein